MSNKLSIYRWNFEVVTKGNSEALKGEISYILDNYPQETIDTMFNSLDTHDIPRAITMLSSAMPYVRDDYRHWEIDRAPTIWHGYNYFATDEFRRFEFEHDKLEQDDYDLAIKRLKVAVILQYFLPGNPCIFYGTEVGLHGFKDPFNRKCYPWEMRIKNFLNSTKKLVNLGVSILVRKVALKSLKQIRMFFPL